MEWSRRSKPTVSQLDIDVTSRLCRSRYSRSLSFARSNNQITPNIKTRPPAKPAAAPHSPAVVPPVIPPTMAPTFAHGLPLNGKSWGFPFQNPLSEPAPKATVI